jgi:ParB-like chromosome segregation protein Spo0J
MEKLKIEYVDIDSIKPYKNNPRINEKAIPYVANSIKDFGFKVPIVLDKNNEIVAGHTRYKASLELGLKEVPCIVADDLNEEQIRAFRLVDNKVAEFSLWDLKTLSEELKDFEGINLDIYGIKNEADELINILEDEGLNKKVEGEKATTIISFSDKRNRIEKIKDYINKNESIDLRELFLKAMEVIDNEDC